MADDATFELFSSVRYDTKLLSVAGNPQYAFAGWNYRQASPYYMLDFHRDRLLRAATHWGWDAAVATVTGDAGLARIEQVLNESVGATDGLEPAQTQPKRCRIVLNKNGEMAAQAFDVPATDVASLLPPTLPTPGFMLGQSAADADRQGRTGSEDDTPLLLDLRAAQAQAPYEVSVDRDTTTSSAHTHYKTTRRAMYDAARQRAGIAGPERREVLLVHAGTDTVMDGSICTVYLYRDGGWVTPPVSVSYAEGRGCGGLDGTTRRWALERGLAREQAIPAHSLQDGEACWMSNGVRGFLYGRIKL